MARPRKQNRRDKQLNLRLTGQEFAWAERRAAASDMALPDFGRAQLLAERKVRKSSEKPAQLAPLFVAQLSRIGNNLNQIARRFHQLCIPAPGELEPLLQAIRAIIEKASRDGA